MAAAARPGSVYLGWAKGLPPNVVLVSGPSKTAGIEQMLAHGVHGPKRLVVVVVP